MITMKINSSTAPDNPACPKCGKAGSKMVSIHKKPGFLVRYRKCNHCDCRFKTRKGSEDKVEKIVDVAPYTEQYRKKLKDDDVRRIRAEVAKGRTRTSLSVEYDVGVKTISNIVTRTTWKHID